MNLSFTEEQQKVSEICADFAQAEIQPRIRELEDSGVFPKDIFAKLANIGLLTMTIPEEAGGTLVDTTSYLLALKAFAKVDAGIAVAVSVTNMVAEAIYRFGSDEQKKKYIGAFARGDYLAASFALTESGAGSDPSAMRTRAETDPKDHNYYILNGEKTFITSGDVAGLFIVMAKTKMPNNTEKITDKITAFLLEPNTPGFKIGKKEQKMGLLTSSTVSLLFENCRIPKSQILGELGKGLALAFTILDSGRIGIAAQAIGIAEACFEESVKYAKFREQFGKPICNNQVIQFKLADMKVKIEAATLLALKAACLKDEKKTFSEEASIAKLYSTEMCNEVAQEAIQIHGGYGYIKESLVEKYFRDARVTTIYEGTSEIQRMIIAKKILKD